MSKKLIYCCTNCSARIRNCHEYYLYIGIQFQTSLKVFSIYASAQQYTSKTDLPKCIYVTFKFKSHATWTIQSETDFRWNSSGPAEQATTTIAAALFVQPRRCALTMQISDKLVLDAGIVFAQMLIMSLGQRNFTTSVRSFAPAMTDDLSFCA